MPNPREHVTLRGSLSCPPPTPTKPQEAENSWEGGAEPGGLALTVSAQLHLPNSCLLGEGGVGDTG